MGPIVTRPVQDPLVVKLLENRLYMSFSGGGGGDLNVFQELCSISKQHYYGPLPSPSPTPTCIQVAISLAFFKVISLLNITCWSCRNIHVLHNQNIPPQINHHLFHLVATQVLAASIPWLLYKIHAKPSELVLLFTIAQMCMSL